MKRVVIFLLVCLSNYSLPVKAQTGLSLEIFNLINQARTNPAEFLKTHKAGIERYDNTYIAYLEKSKPVSAIVWDNALAEQAKKKIDNNELSPSYKGNNTLCGSSSGKRTGTVSQDALFYVCDIYKNIHNDDYAYIGLYFNKNFSGYCYELGKTCERKLIPFSYTGGVDSSKVDFEKLNTAKKVTWMNAQEKRMVLEINFARAYPKVYAQIISQHLANESGSSGLAKDVYEAGMELIDELNTMSPRSILVPQECVYKAAKKHAADCERRKIMDHTGSDGSDPWDRILKECSSLKTGNENLAGAGGNNPRNPVINLLLDDGISSRGHRYNMLDEKWVYVGVSQYVMEKSAWYTMYGWVQNFAY
ncbi:MAG TPA: CAP domain-containing protein [Flavobacteriales bacterium]|nr:CAP domain-containing protein [Flavobacteriales bacterium]